MEELIIVRHRQTGCKQPRVCQAMPGVLCCLLLTAAANSWPGASGCRSGLHSGQMGFMSSLPERLNSTFHFSFPEKKTYLGL